MKEYITPIKIIAEENVIGGDNLLIDKALQVGFYEPYLTKFSKGSYIVLDYGKEICGGIRIMTTLTNGVSVHVRFGESVSECYSEIGNKNATNDHAPRDFEFKIFSNWCMQEEGDTGFRFVRLDFSDDITIKGIVAYNNILVEKPVYMYSGNDREINDIFLTAKRTIDLCASSGYIWDGIKRDRLVWIGDMHPEMLAITSLYGKSVEVENSLDFIRQNTPLPNWMNSFPTYSMWWIIIVSDYYERTGQTEFARNQLPYMIDLVKQMLDNVKEDGTMCYPAYFLDWPTHEKTDEIPGVRAINIISAKSALKLFNTFGIDDKLAKELYDRLLKQPIEIKESKQAIALKYFAVGIDDRERDILLNGGANGVSTFMSYYILKAISSFDKKSAIDIMKKYYGAMLSLGATTFWEDFDMAWLNGNICPIDRLPKEDEKDIHGDYGAYCYEGFRHSLCHGWSSGVIAFIKEECK